MSRSRFDPTDRMPRFGDYRSSGGSGGGGGGSLPPGGTLSAGSPQEMRRQRSSHQVTQSGTGRYSGNYSTLDSVNLLEFPSDVSEGADPIPSHQPNQHQLLFQQQQQQQQLQQQQQQQQHDQFQLSSRQRLDGALRNGGGSGRVMPSSSTLSQPLMSADISHGQPVHSASQEGGFSQPVAPNSTSFRGGGGGGGGRSGRDFPPEYSSNSGVSSGSDDMLRQYDMLLNYGMQRQQEKPSGVGRQQHHRHHHYQQQQQQQQQQQPSHQSHSDQQRHYSSRGSSHRHLHSGSVQPPQTRASDRRLHERMQAPTLLSSQSPPPYEPKHRAAGGLRHRRRNPPAALANYGSEDDSAGDFDDYRAMEDRAAARDAPSLRPKHRGGDFRRFSSELSRPRDLYSAGSSHSSSASSFNFGGPVNSDELADSDGRQQGRLQSFHRRGLQNSNRNHQQLPAPPPPQQTLSHQPSPPSTAGPTNFSSGDGRRHSQRRRCDAFPSESAVPANSQRQQRPLRDTRRYVSAPIMGHNRQRSQQDQRRLRFSVESSDDATDGANLSDGDGFAAGDYRLDNYSAPRKPRSALDDRPDLTDHSSDSSASAADYAPRVGADPAGWREASRRSETIYSCPHVDLSLLVRTFECRRCGKCGSQKKPTKFSVTAPSSSMGPSMQPQPQPQPAVPPPPPLAPQQSRSKRSEQHWRPGRPMDEPDLPPGLSDGDSWHQRDKRAYDPVRSFRQDRHPQQLQQQPREHQRSRPSSQFKSRRPRHREDTRPVRALRY